jgi:predicted nucleotidyltransferase
MARRGPCGQGRCRTADLFTGSGGRGPRRQRRELLDLTSENITLDGRNSRSVASGVMTAPMPEPHGSFLTVALARLAADRRLVGVALSGSGSTGRMDGFSDIDLVIAVEPDDFAEVLADRPRIGASLGGLLTAFTGEHVGEPRLLICFYGPPPLHVDLKFVALPDAADRVDDLQVRWERDGRLSAVLAAPPSAPPAPDPQWIEDRFWGWVHYITTKIGRGELFDAIEGLSFLRGTVLGPLALHAAGRPPYGVRRLETYAPALAAELRGSLPRHDAAECAAALRVIVAAYQRLRGADMERRTAAERVMLAYLDEVADRL